MDESPPKLALVTGASGGIGEAFAHLLAEYGYRLVIVARNEGALNRVAGIVTSRFATSVLPISLDLSEAHAGAALSKELAGRGLEPEVIVNNAGYGRIGPAVELPLDDQIGMVDVNVRTLTDLTLRFLPRLVERATGGVINVASLAGYMPGPNMAVYYATKAYVLSLSEALAAELQGTGVTVTALCPGAVVTGFQARAGMEDLPAYRRAPKKSAEEVARAGWDGFRRGERVVLPGTTTALTAWALQLTPHRLLLPIVRSALDPRQPRAS